MNKPKSRKHKTYFKERQEFHKRVAEKILCNKAGFKAKKTALAYRDKCIKAHEKELNIYKCQECKRWHLTSQTKGEVNGY